MKILDDKVMKDVIKALSKMKNEVNLVLFTKEEDCHLCKDMHQLMTELTTANPLVKLQAYDFDKDKAEVEKYNIDKVPALVVMDEKDRGIRLFGIPSGYEFSSLLSAILMVSTGITKLKDETKKYLDSLKEDIHLQVFVTPTCPHCPPAVILAHQMAYYSDKVRADMVEVTEFPHLGDKYSVAGVPRTVINEDWFQEGAAPESYIIEKIKESVQ